MSASHPVPETSLAAKPPKPSRLPRPDTRMRRENQKSPFTVPDTHSMALLSLKDEEQLKEAERKKFLALPIGEKATYAARMKGKSRKGREEKTEEEEEEQEEEMKNQSKSVRHEVKAAMMKRENFTRESKHELISMQREAVQVELSLMTKRSEMQEMDEAIAREERKQRKLEKILEKELRTANVHKSVTVRRFEQETKSKQEPTAVINKLLAEIATTRREIATMEETLTEYKSYKELLFKLSPPEWQEEHKKKKKKVPSGGGGGGGGGGAPDQEEAPGEEQPPLRETRSSSDHEESRIAPSKPDSDDSDYEDEPRLFFTDPQQLVDLLSALDNQVLCLMQDTGRVEGTLKGLEQSTDTARRKMEEEEEQVTLRINEVKERIDGEMSRIAELRRWLNTAELKAAEQDGVLDALGEKVAEVYGCCVDDGVTYLSTQEKLIAIEKYMNSLQEELDGIPEETLKTMKKIKASERRRRQREEELREREEKREERRRRYMERALVDNRKRPGKKFTPKTKPDPQISNTDDRPKDDMYSCLFDSKDTK